MTALTLLVALLLWLGIPSPRQALPKEPPNDLVMTIKPVSFSDEVGGFTAELDAPYAAHYVFRVLVSLGRPEKESFPKVAIIAGIAVPERIKFRFSPPEIYELYVGPKPVRLWQGMKGSFEILGAGLTCVEVRIAHRSIAELKGIGATEFSVTFETRRPNGTNIAGEQRVPIEHMPQPGKNTASCKNRTRSYERNEESTL